MLNIINMPRKGNSHTVYECKQGSRSVAMLKNQYLKIAPQKFLIIRTLAATVLSYNTRFIVNNVRTITLILKLFIIIHLSDMITYDLTYVRILCNIILKITYPCMTRLRNWPLNCTPNHIIWLILFSNYLPCRICYSLKTPHSILRSTM